MLKVCNKSGCDCICNKAEAFGKVGDAILANVNIKIFMQVAEQQLPDNWDTHCPLCKHLRASI